MSQVVELAIEELKCHKSLGSDQIPSELIKARGRTIRCEIHKFITSIWNKEELPEMWKSRSLYLSIRREIKQTVVIIRAYHFCLLRTYKILSNILLSRLTPYAEEIIGYHQCGFWCNSSTTDHIFCIHQPLSYGSPSVVRPFKISILRTHRRLSDALRPFKCPIQPCTGLEL